jgi:hypothetical protein
LSNSATMDLVNALPHFADGGEISSNMPSIVGENGPEPFIPRTAGTIIPNNRARSMFGGGDVHYHIDARGADPSAVEARVRQATSQASRQGAAMAQTQMMDRSRRVPR